MSLSTVLSSFPAVIVDTLVGHLALLFLTAANGDQTAAAEAARKMLAAYRPETEDELRLAAEIICFSFHTLESLGQATTPDMPLTRILRLRGSAVSLSREGQKARRKLDELQTARRTDVAPQPEANPSPQPEPSRPQIDKAPALIEAASPAPALTSKVWTQSYQQREAANRIAEKLRNNQAAHAAQLAAQALFQKPEDRITSS